MRKIKTKGWKPPKTKEVYTESLSPRAKVFTRDYVKRADDQYVLLAEFAAAALSGKAAWKEAMRAARNIVRHYLIDSVIVEHSPEQDGRHENFKVYERYNFSDLEQRAEGIRTKNYTGQTTS